MAMAAAHFQTGAEPAERAALLWLEGSGRGDEVDAPHLAAPEGTLRAVVTHYVPVNDKAGPSKAVLHSLPLTRERQERTFARAWLDSDTVYLIWPELNPPPEHRRALEALCAKVTRVGHSSSLVQMWLADSAETYEPNWVPDDTRGTIRLRIAGPGTLEHLEQEYNAMAMEDYATLRVEAETAPTPKERTAARRRLKRDYDNNPPRQQRPILSLYQGYAAATTLAKNPGVPGTIYSPHFIALKLVPEQGPYRELDLAATHAIVLRWREAILSHSNGEPDRVRSILSGHDREGAPLKEPHLAFLPLPFVDHEHADGHLLGIGLVLPATIERDERRAILRVLGQVQRLKLGRLGLWKLVPVTESRPPWNLRPETWTAYTDGATHWTSVTPVALDRHPKAKGEAAYRQELARMISQSCERIGLPPPRDVIPTFVSTHLGAPPAHAFPKLMRKDGSERRHTHAILIFDEPVCGPLLIGAGRFRGYGAFRPQL